MVPVEFDISKQGNPVESLEEARKAAKAVFPQAGSVEDEDAEFGVYLVDVPMSVVNLLVERGYLMRDRAGYVMEAEMP